MKRRQFLAIVPGSLALGIAPGGSSCRADSGDGRFPATIATRISGKAERLTLTGIATRKKYGLSIYTVASYLREGARVGDAESLAGADVPKILHLVFERQVDGPTIATAFRASIGASHPAPAFASELARLERYFLPLVVRSGDHVWLTHVPGVGLACQAVAQPVVVIDGVDFARAAWGTYLGRINLGVALKDGLTSRLR